MFERVKGYTKHVHGKLVHVRGYERKKDKKERRRFRRK